MKEKTKQFKMGQPPHIWCSLLNNAKSRRYVGSDECPDTTVSCEECKIRVALEKYPHLTREGLQKQISS